MYGFLSFSKKMYIFGLFSGSELGTFLEPDMRRRRFRKRKGGGGQAAPVAAGASRKWKSGKLDKGDSTVKLKTSVAEPVRNFLLVEDESRLF